MSKAEEVTARAQAKSLAASNRVYEAHCRHVWQDCARSGPEPKQTEMDRKLFTEYAQRVLDWADLDEAEAADKDARDKKLQSKLAETQFQAWVKKKESQERRERPGDNSATSTSTKSKAAAAPFGAGGERGSAALGGAGADSIAGPWSSVVDTAMLRKA